MSNKLTRHGTTLNERTVAELARQAKDEDRSHAWMIRQAILRMLKQNNPEWLETEP